MRNGENYAISKNAKVKVTQLGNKVEVRHTLFQSNNLDKFRKISKKEYINKETGEVFEYNKKSQKSQQALAKQIKNLKALILANFNPTHNALFITLTFNIQISTINSAKKYLSKFLRRLRSFFEKEEKKPLYIYRFEIGTNTKRVHIHMLLRDENNTNIYLSSEFIEKKLWKMGFVTVKPIYKENNNSGLEYIEDNIMDFGISEYMTKETQIDRNDLNNYDRIFGCSRNVIKPKIVLKSTYEEAQKLIKDYSFIDEKTLLIRDEQTNKIINKIKSETYTDNKKGGTKNE